MIVWVMAHGLLGATPLDHLPGPIPATLVRVIDGDSFVVKANTWIGQETTVTVRPIGYDSAEMRGKCPRERALALRAQADLERILNGAAGLLLSDITPDKFGGRVNARVTLAPAGTNLTDRMLKAAARSGHSRPWTGRRIGWCEDK